MADFRYEILLAKANQSRVQHNDMAWLAAFLGSSAAVMGGGADYVSSISHDTSVILASGAILATLGGIASGISAIIDHHDSRLYKSAANVEIVQPSVIVHEQIKRPY